MEPAAFPVLINESEELIQHLMLKLVVSGLNIVERSIPLGQLVDRKGPDLNPVAEPQSR
jgi:hypothetical protein